MLLVLQNMCKVASFHVYACIHPEMLALKTLTFATVKRTIIRSTKSRFGADYEAAEIGRAIFVAIGLNGTI